MMDGRTLTFKLTFIFCLIMEFCRNCLLIESDTTVVRRRVTQVCFIRYYQFYMHTFSHMAIIEFFCFGLSVPTKRLISWKLSFGLVVRPFLWFSNLHLVAENKMFHSIKSLSLLQRRKQSAPDSIYAHTSQHFWFISTRVRLLPNIFCGNDKSVS